MNTVKSSIFKQILTGALCYCVFAAYAAVDLVKVDKSRRRMYLYDGATLVREYRIALGRVPRGHKQQSGDSKTPEGRYYLEYVSEDSAFYRSVHISYPNNDDIRRAQAMGVAAGGDIKVHGLANGDRRHPLFVQSFDWTNGCIALTNQEIDEFIDLVSMGTPIEIEW